ncbi:hypothetical protein EV363DRAFT_1105774, partial [Boletus edulis]
MSPKKRKAATKVSKKASKMDVDQGVDASGSGTAAPTTQAGIDKYIDQFHDLEEKARGALIGYAQTDIIKRNLVFGKYNRRDLNAQEKRSLLDSFNQNGLDRFGINHVVPLIVDKALVDETTIVTLTAFQETKRDGSHLPFLRLKGDEVVKNGSPTFGPHILAAGGRHRRHALMDWLKQRESMAAAATKTVNDLTKKASKDGDEEDAVSEEQIEAAEVQLEYAKRLLNMGGLWIVSIYDKDLIESHGNSVGYHLSTNQRLYSYAETAEEGIIQTYLMMVSHKKTWMNCEVAQGLRPQSHGYKITSLLQQDYVWKLMDTLVDMNETHYVNSDIFKMTRLTNDLLSEHGGLLAAVVIFLENRLRLCFNTAEWDEAKVKKSQQTLANSTSSQEAKKVCDDYLVICMENLEFATPAKGAINDALRKQIDSVYKMTLGHSENWKYFGTYSTAWKTEYSKYVKGVVAAMQTMSTNMLKEENATEMSDDMKRVWKDCASKAKLVLECKNYPKQPPVMPFMSVSVWQSLSQQFKRVPNALVEVSSWFSPLVYNHKIVGGRWKIGSATAEMMRALSAHPDLTPELVYDAITVCTWTIVANFGALLRLEEDLTAIDMPKRPESAKVVKELMLLEGEHKASKPWKAGQPMKVERAADDSDDDFLKKELNLEALVMDEAIKIQLRSHWMDKSPTPWLDSWWRQIKIDIPKKLHNKDIYRTATLLNYHTGYWGPTSAPSEARARKETTSVAIAEFCTILNYRVPLLCNTQSSAAHIRTLLELSLSFAINGETARQGKAGLIFTWPDGIVFDSKDAFELSFDVDTENSRSLLNASRKRDQESIQKIINLVQSTPVAWPVVDENDEDEETPTTSKSQAVRANVATILENLVKTLVDNAYEHRVKSLDVEMADADADAEQNEITGGKHIPEEDRLKFKFLHPVEGWDKDDKDEIGDKPVAVKTHATSISCLFSASQTKNRLVTLGQIVEEPSSQTTVVAGESSSKPTTPVRTRDKDNLNDVDMQPSSPLPNAFEDID